MNKVTIPMKYEITNEILNENFHKVKLYICHNGTNYNGSSFSDLAIAKASKTLQNIPILAYIERDEEGNALGFGGHEVEYKIEEKDGELYFREHYLEVPIGVIPSQNEYSIESINDKNYVVCSGYIWKCYSNEAIDMLLENNEQSVSMEISVNDGKFLDNGIYDVLDYEYLGVTVIGVEPAMENAKIQMSFSANDNINYQKAVKDLNTLLKNFDLLKGGESMENEEKFEQEVQDEIDAQEEIVVEGTNFEVDEPEEVQEEEFAEEEPQEEICPDCGKPLSECECEKDEEEMAKKKKKCSCDEEPVEEKLYSQAELDEAVASVKAELEESVAFAQSMQEELEALRKFKADYDKAVEVQKMNEEMDNLVANFNIDEELVQDLRNKVLANEISMDKFELELYRNGNKSNKKENNKKEFGKLPVIDKEDNLSDIDKLFNYYGIPKKNKK